MGFKERIAEALVSARMRGAATLLASRSFNSLISLVFTLLAGRLLAVEDYGQFSQSLARIVIAQAVTEAGLQFSLVRFMAPAVQAGQGQVVADLIRASLRVKFYAAALTASFFIAALVAVLGAPALGSRGIPEALLPSSHPDLLLHLWLIFLGGFGMSVLSYLESVLTAHEKYYRLSLWLPSVGVIRISLLAFFAMPGEAPRAEHVVFAFSLGPYLAAAAFFLFFPASFFFQPSREEDWKPWVPRLLNYNLWILAASFMSILADWMEIHLIQDSQERGLYSAARMPMQGFLLLLATMQSVLLPRFAGLKTRDEFKVLFRKLYFFIVLLIILLLPGFLALSWFIPWWFGSQFDAAVRVFWILYPNFLLRLLFAPLGTALYVMDQPRLIALEAGLRMTAGFFLNLILIRSMGIMGAALASLLSQFAGWALLLYLFFGYFRRGRLPLSGNSN